MSHAEIWDDSALVNSWNEALEEYKYYHSLQARGEKVEDVPKHSTDQDHGLEAVVEDGLADQEATKIVERENGRESSVQEEVATRSSQQEPLLKPQLENKLSEADQTSRTKRSEVKTGVGPPPALRHLIGSVHDEGLKNLLMSWYYAGYYTGLYEGQHQARQAEAEGR